MSYTEFVNVLDILPEQDRFPRTLGPRVERKLVFTPEERPVVFQIFDNDTERLLKCALHLQESEPDIIDINMGCSDNRVAGRGAGAGLLRTPIKIGRIFRKLSQALDVPITGKIRLGWDEDTLNYLLVARVIEENGGEMVAVHGRTKAQGYLGTADWDAIAEIKQAVSIPVLGNGDVCTVADIERLKTHTGCDGVMIGRGAIGNPWIFSRMDRQQVPPDLVRRTMLSHLERMLSFYNGDYGLVLFRKHVSRYLSPVPFTSEQRKRLLTAERPAEFLELLDTISLEV